MPYNLPAMARARGQRVSKTIATADPTKAQAQDLAKLYLEVMRVWQQAVPRIIEKYNPTPLSIDNPSNVQSEIDRAASEASRLIFVFGAKARTWALSIDRWHRAKWAAAVLATVSVDVSLMLTALPVQETVESFLARNAALVTNVSDQAKARISDAVMRGYQDRLPVRDVAKELNDALGLGRQRSIRIAADQTRKLASALDRERQAEAGIELMKWRHSGKKHPRLPHKARDGVIYHRKSGKARDGSSIIPAGDRASMAPHCGCREQAYLAIEDTL